MQSLGNLMAIPLSKICLRVRDPWAIIADHHTSSTQMVMSVKGWTSLYAGLFAALAPEIVDLIKKRSAAVEPEEKEEEPFTADAGADTATNVNGGTQVSGGTYAAAAALVCGCGWLESRSRQYNRRARFVGVYHRRSSCDSCDCGIAGAAVPPGGAKVQANKTALPNGHAAVVPFAATSDEIEDTEVRATRLGGVCLRAQCRTNSVCCCLLLVPGGCC